MWKVKCERINKLAKNESKKRDSNKRVRKTVRIKFVSVKNDDSKKMSELQMWV